MFHVPAHKSGTAGQVTNPLPAGDRCHLTQVGAERLAAWVNTHDMAGPFRGPRATAEQGFGRWFVRILSAAYHPMKNGDRHWYLEQELAYSLQDARDILGY